MTKLKAVSCVIAIGFNAHKTIWSFRTLRTKDLLGRRNSDVRRVFLATGPTLHYDATKQELRQFMHRKNLK